MKPDQTVTLPVLADRSQAAIASWLDDYDADLWEAGETQICPWSGALADILEHATEPTTVELYSYQLVDDRGYIRSYPTIHLAWSPQHGRAALEAGADWDWTDAADPEDALRRYLEDDMSP